MLSCLPTVAPVIDYEPPIQAANGRYEAPVPAPRPHTPRSAPRTGHGGTGPLPATLQSAAVFADAALRRVLEVIDRRRPVGQLHPLLAVALAESVRPVDRAGHTGAATLQRVRVQPVGGAEDAVEVFGTYRRGQRVHALAGRIARVHTAGPGWQMVALHIG